VDVVVVDPSPRLSPAASWRADGQSRSASSPPDGQRWQVAGTISKTKLHRVFINQLRGKFGVIYGKNRRPTPGGRA
jgi:RecA/RadA recombinase